MICLSSALMCASAEVVLLLKTCEAPWKVTGFNGRPSTKSVEPVEPVLRMLRLGERAPNFPGVPADGEDLLGVPARAGLLVFAGLPPPEKRG